MNYPADQGGHFDSDVHRRVLAHLSAPDDDYGWALPGLFVRLSGDSTVRFDTTDELASVLQDLESQDHAERFVALDPRDPEKHVEVWRMSQSGFDLLTGPIKNEPPVGAPPQGPAVITAAVALGMGSTKLVTEGN